MALRELGQEEDKKLFENIFGCEVLQQRVFKDGISCALFLFIRFT